MFQKSGVEILRSISGRISDFGGKPMRKTGGALFAGGGLCEESFPEIDWILSVELNPAIAQHHRVAHPDTLCLTADVSDVDYRPFAGADYLHASPPCTAASVANSQKGERELDRVMARAVCRAIREIKPHVFTLENVRGYAEFESFALIQSELFGLGYRFDYAVYNSANYGSAQTRLRAVCRLCGF